MQFIFARHMFMHFHALHVPFSFFPMPYSFRCVSILLSLSFSLLIMAPKNTVPSKNSIRRGSSSSSFPFDFVWVHDEKTRNDFFENFYDRAIHSEHHVILSDSWTLLYPVLLALGDELLFVRNPRGVLACSYRSFTPICTPSIPLYLSLLRYSVVHVL